ncbi:MAG: ATPase [Flavobacteriales bacterium BRH_c54]|nr:MAG: ATPase [Flavobacteriales bacterium BRH_c54]
MKITDKPIVVEQTFDVSITELWNAITELKQMTQWFFENIESFEPKVGFETKFVIENEGRVFSHLWKITEVERLKKITYNWKYEEYTGDSFVTFELVNQGKNTKLKLVHTTTKDFPSNIPEFTRESCVGGWNYFIKQRLKEYLKKQ